MSSNVGSVVDPLCPQHGNVPPDAQLGPNDGLDLVLEAVGVLVQTVLVDFNAMENQVVAPTAVDFIEAVLQSEKSDTNMFTLDLLSASI